MGTKGKAVARKRWLKLPSMGIRAKITLGFAAVLLVLVAVAGANLWTSDRTGTEVNRFAMMVAAEERAANILHKFSAMRLEAQSFSVEGSPDSAKMMQDYATELEPLLNAAVEEAHNEQLRAAAEMGKKAFTEYMAAFNSFVEVRQAWQKEADERLRPNAQTLLETISIMIDDALFNDQTEVISYLQPAREHALNLRYNIARYLGDKDSDSADAVSRQHLRHRDAADVAGIRSARRRGGPELPDPHGVSQGCG